MLTSLELFNGIITTIFTIVSAVIGIRIIIKFVKQKKIEYLTLGLTFIFLGSPWWGIILSTWYHVITGGLQLSSHIYLFISNVFIPFAIYFWLYSLSTIFNYQQKAIISRIALLFSVIFEVIIIVSLIVDPSWLGIVTRFNAESGIFGLILRIGAIGIGLITCTHFAIKSMKSEDRIIKWRGRLLLIAFISFFVGGALDIFSGAPTMPIFISRLVLILSFFELYIGFFPPEKLKNYLLKNGDKPDNKITNDR